MRFTLLAVAGVSGALLLGGLGCGGHNSSSVTNPNTSTFTPTGTVSGVLVDSVSNKPIAGATIAIMTQTTTTGAQGQFTLYNVPASGTSVGVGQGNPSAPYPVVIDLTAYNKGLASGTAPYPNYVYASVAVTYSSLGDAQPGSSSNHATPVAGFVANMNPTVGKLDANLQILVLNGKTLAPVSGATVNLLAAANSGNSATGVTPNQVATQTTNAAGMVTFSNVEAAQEFIANAMDSTGAYSGTLDVQTQGDGTTTSYVTPNPNVPAGQPFFATALMLSPLSQQAPYLIGSTPASLSDIAPGATSVVYTFSRPIASNAYSQALTAAQSQATSSTNDPAPGLWGDVFAQFNGAKSGNLPYTLSWSTDMTQLSVNFTTAPASRYSVNLNAVRGSGLLVDAYGNAMTDPLGLSEVDFTTNGGSTPTAPVIVQDLQPGFNLDVTWPRTDNTYQYVVFMQRYLGGVLDDQGEAPTSQTRFDVSLIEDGNNNEVFRDWTPVVNGEPGQLIYSYQVTVYALPTVASRDYANLGVASNTVTLKNLILPHIQAVDYDPTYPILVPAPPAVLDVPGGAGAVTSYTHIVTFIGEAPMQRDLVENPANWTVREADAHDPGGAWEAQANDILPVIKQVTLAPDGFTATLTVTVTNTAAANATWDAPHVVYSFTGTDITGNALEPTSSEFDLEGGIF